MTRKALFPGSFDPITKGHEALVRRARTLFDEIIIGIGVNSDKKYLFDLDQRVKWIEETFADDVAIRVESYTGLTVNFAKELDAGFILRGLRNSGDFQFEKGIAQMNKAMVPEVETVFLLTAPELSAINSSIVRDIIRNGGDPSAFVPDAVTIG